MKNSMQKAGELVCVITKEGERIEGTLIPSSETGIVLVKLKSGYNLGIKKENVRTVMLLQQKKEKEPKERKEIAQQKNLPHITLLHTGGTIASKVDYETGAVVAKFSPEDVLELVPELQRIAQVKTVLVSNIQSESMRFGHYNLIGKAIAKELEGKEKPKGIIITHGTDTLHYTAAALAFMLEGIDIPVILVGSQRSSDRGSSDAAINLICAAKFIVQSDFTGVAICMHAASGDEKAIVLPATKSRKLHTSRRDAFKPVNAATIAEVPYKEGEIRWIQAVDARKEAAQSKKAASLKLFRDRINVGILRTHTNMYPADFLHYKSFDGLIIEGTGLGHAQTTGFDAISAINEKNKKALAQVAKKAVVVMTSQCIFGSVNMNVYSPQRELLKLGVLPGADMTTETAFIKLAWLLSNYKKEEVKKLMMQNLRGELRERTAFEEVNF